jgi:hypothetical protein
MPRTRLYQITGSLCNTPFAIASVAMAIAPDTTADDFQGEPMAGKRITC